MVTVRYNLICNISVMPPDPRFGPLLEEEIDRASAEERPSEQLPKNSSGTLAKPPACVIP
jgi:hypothetical protein